MVFLYVLGVMGYRLSVSVLLWIVLISSTMLEYDCRLSHQLFTLGSSACSLDQSLGTF